MKFATLFHGKHIVISLSGANLSDAIYTKNDGFYRDTIWTEGFDSDAVGAKSIKNKLSKEC